MNLKKLAILIIFLLLIEELLYWFLIKSVINYQKNHIEKVDINFFQKEDRNNLINNINNILINLENNVNFIEITKDNITYYSDKNIITKSIVWFEINYLIKKLNIITINIKINSNWEFLYLEVIFQDKKDYFIYKIKHNYNLWDETLIPKWKAIYIIDNNWFILRECERLVCEESK